MAVVRSSRRKPQRARTIVGVRRPSARCNFAELKKDSFNDPLADILRGLVQEQAPQKVVVPFVRRAQ